MASLAQYIKHTTTAGDRWDLLAWRYYGDPANYGPIVMANPGVPIEPVFPGGRAITVPIITAPATMTTGLPPWKTQG